MYLILNIEFQLNKVLFVDNTISILLVPFKWISKANTIYNSNYITFFNALSFREDPLFLKLAWDSNNKYNN